VGHKDKEDRLAYAAGRRKDPAFVESVRKYNAAYRKANQSTLAKYDVEYYRKHSIRIVLRRKGIVDPDLQRKLEAHHGRCDLCGGPPDGRWGRLNVDHCHTTGEFRGMLCTGCNRGIGYFRDRTDLLTLAVGYLQRSDATRKMRHT
jgi:hypothetical protein